MELTKYIDYAVFSEFNDFEIQVELFSSKEYTYHNNLLQHTEFTDDYATTLYGQYNDIRRKIHTTGTNCIYSAIDMLKRDILEIQTSNTSKQMIIQRSHYPTILLAKNNFARLSINEITCLTQKINRICSEKCLENNLQYDLDISFSILNYEVAIENTQHTKLNFTQSNSVIEVTVHLYNSFDNFYDTHSERINYVSNENNLTLLNHFSNFFQNSIMYMTSNNEFFDRDTQFIFTGECFSNLLFMFAGHFYASWIEDHTSFFANKLNKKIMSSIVTIIDNATLPYGFSSRPFDLEGTPSKKTTIINNGYFSSPLHNIETAQKYQSESTGNYDKDIYIKFSNLYISPSNNKISIEKNNTYLQIEQILDLEMGTNVYTGDATYHINGKYIKNGKVIKFLKNYSININFFSLINSICEIGNDLTFNLYGVGCPSIKVNSLQ